MTKEKLKDPDDMTDEDLNMWFDNTKGLFDKWIKCLCANDIPIKWIEEEYRQFYEKEQ